MVSLMRVAGMVCILLLTSCSTSSNRAFESGPSPDKAIVVVGGAYRVNNPTAEGAATLNMIAELSAAPRNFGEALAQFRRYDPVQGRALNTVALLEPSPARITVWVGKPDLIYDRASRAEQFAIPNYAMFEVTPGSWYLDRVIMRSFGRETTIKSLNNQNLRPGVPVFEVRPGEVLYIGDVVLAAGSYLIAADPTRFGRLPFESWNLATASDVREMTISVAERIDAASIIHRPMTQYRP